MAKFGSLDDIDPAIHRTGSAIDATADVIEMCLGTKTKVESIVDQKFDQFLALRFTEETFEEGIRYFVQVDVGDGELVHICLMRMDDPDLPIRVAAVQISKSTDSL